MESEGSLPSSLEKAMDSGLCQVRLVHHFTYDFFKINFKTIPHLRLGIPRRIFLFSSHFSKRYLYVRVFLISPDHTKCFARPVFLDAMLAVVIDHSYSSYRPNENYTVRYNLTFKIKIHLLTVGRAASFSFQVDGALT